MQLLISAEVIHAKVLEVAAKINAEYAGEELTIVMVLKGALCLTADLMRALKIPTSVEMIRATSYGALGVHRGELTITGLEDLDIAGKNVLIVDDIFDSGNTLLKIVQRMQEKKPKTLKTLVLLSKRVVRQTSYIPDYVLFPIDPFFVVGYGLDYKEYYRGLPGIYNFEG